MRALILAAGRGSRMKDLTTSKPKCLVELHQKPLLRYQIESLRSAGVREIGIVVGYASEKLAPYVREFDLKVFENGQWADSNMVYSLCCARDWLLDFDELIVSYSDIFYSVEAVNILLSAQSKMGILYDTQWLTLWQNRFSDPLSDAESFKFEADKYGKRILYEIGARVNDIGEIQGQYMGLLRFNQVGLKRLFALIDSQNLDFIKKLDMTSLLKLCLSKGEQIECLAYNGIWGECDNQDDVALYERLYPCSSLSSLTQIKNHSQIKHHNKGDL